MAYTVAIMPAALRQLAGLPKREQKRIKYKIDRLSAEPRPAGVKRLHGQREYLRLRSGDYRIIYTVEDSRRRVVIVVIGHRREVYRAR